MEKISKAEWDKIPAGCKGVWTTERLELVEELDCLAAANDPRAIAARSAIAKAIGTGDTK